MTEYIYFVKCADCDDELFMFFDEAKEFAMSCLNRKPIITQTEVNRNDFGECVDSCDLGTVWSWEALMGDVTDDEPAKSVFTRDDLAEYNPDNDAEFDAIDNSVDFEINEIPEVSAIDEVPDNFRKPVPADMAIEDLVEALEEHEDLVECKSCFNLFPKTDCMKHDHGYLCHDCDSADYKTTISTDEVLTDLVADEFEAIAGYEVADEVVRQSDMPEEKKTAVIDTLDHIKKEEEEHIDELKELFNDDDTKVTSEESGTLYEDVDDLEVDEDTVECTWCNELFDRSECRYEVDLGWLCSRCEAAIKSRGETLTFREGSYWDFLDESAEPITEASLSDIAASVNAEFGSDLNSDDILDKTGVEDSRHVNLTTKLTPSEKAKIEKDKAAARAYRRKLADWKHYQNSKAESINEAFNPEEQIEFEYNDLKVTLFGNIQDRETGTYDDHEIKVNYLYYRKAQDVATDIWENFITDEDVAEVSNGLEALLDDELWGKFLETHFDTLFDKYYENLLEYYREDATTKCEMTYSYQDYLDGELSDASYKMTRKLTDEEKQFLANNKNSVLEELEDSDAYRARLTTCPECGAASLDLETGICINCGFNTLD